jgi:hypothetical protein
MLLLVVLVDNVDNNQLSLQLNVQVDQEILHQSKQIKFVILIKKINFIYFTLVISIIIAESASSKLGNA